MNSTSQPVWKCVANLGDVNPIDYGGCFVLVDTTGVYPPECEMLAPPEDDERGAKWEVCRFVLENCTYQNGILSDNQFHPDHPAWFAKDLESLAKFAGMETSELVNQFISDDPIQRAQAWILVGEYWGFHELDHYHLELSKTEVSRRYKLAKYRTK